MWMDWWVYGLVGDWVVWVCKWVWVIVCVGGRVVGCAYGWVDRRVDGWPDEWVGWSVWNGFWVCVSGCDFGWVCGWTGGRGGV